MTKLGRALKLLEDDLWIDDVDTMWQPNEGTFKLPAKKLAQYLKKNSNSLKQAMSRLNFYINRAGDNLSDEDKKRLELAKEELDKLYA